jgi:protein-disulfide isomerase
MPTPLAFRGLRSCLAAAGLILLAACAAEDGMTRAQGDAILAELKAIHESLEQNDRNDRPEPAKPAPTVHVPTAGGQAFGRADAPLTLVEFTDFQCPFCRRFHDRTWPEVKKNYVDTGKLRYLVLDLPLPFHAGALPSALGAHCAAEQGKYWPMHDRLFGIAEDQLTAAHIRELALSLGVDASRYDACLAAAKTTAAIDASSKAANNVGLTGTPSFVLGHATGDAVDGAAIVGAQPYEVFAARIDSALSALPAPAAH